MTLQLRTLVVNMENMMKIKRVIRLCIGICLILMIGFGGYYVSDYYEAESVAVSALISDNDVTISKLDNDYYVFEPSQATKGLIFYPGGKVSYSAYAPLLRELANKGILCILVEMPFNLAVLDMNAANGISELYPNIDDWYIGGHSLGGAIAASYVSNHIEEFEGLLLLASYSTSDIHDSDINVVSIYGSNDEILDMGRYEEAKVNLPKTTFEMVIDGGCHSYFGNYGMQEGDGTPTITRETQFATTIEYSLEYLFN